MSSDKPSSSTSSEFCCYHPRPCSRPRYQKYDYCVHHILEDTSSPFTSCEYKSRTSGRKCPNPASRSHKVNNMHAFCEEHLRELIVKEQHQKQKKKLRKKRKSGKILEENPGVAKRQKLIDRLAKYNKDSSNKTSDHETSDSEVEEVHRPITDDWLIDNENFGNNTDWDDFDPVNNEVYEPLRYADVLTPEEVVATAQSKLIRLQSLYIEQFKRLSHLLKERRRQYLCDGKKEKLRTSAEDDEDSVDEEEIYALATYRKRSGVEVLLRKRQIKRRREADASTSNFNSTSVTTSRCSHSTSHTRCKESCLPYTKYCSLHILSDPHQQLYKKCHTKNCLNPVCCLTSRPYESTVKDSEDKSEEVCYCIFHASLPEMTFKFPEQKKPDVEIDVDVEASGELAKDAFPGESQERREGESKVDKDASSEVHTQPVEETESTDDILKQQQDCDAMVVDGSISETSAVAAIRPVPAPENVPVASEDSIPDHATESSTVAAICPVPAPETGPLATEDSIPDQATESSNVAAIRPVPAPETGPLASADSISDQATESSNIPVLPSPGDEIDTLGGLLPDSGEPSNSEKIPDVVAVTSPPGKDQRLEESSASLDHSVNEAAEPSASECDQPEQIAALGGIAMKVEPLPTHPPSDCTRVFQLEENNEPLLTTSTFNNREELASTTDCQKFTTSPPRSPPRPEENSSSPQKVVTPSPPRSPPRPEENRSSLQKVVTPSPSRSPPRPEKNRSSPQKVVTPSPRRSPPRPEKNGSSPQKGVESGDGDVQTHLDAQEDFSKESTELKGTLSASSSPKEVNVDSFLNPEDEFTLDPDTGVLLSAVREAVSDSAKADITPETDIPEPNIDNNCTGVPLSAVREAFSDSANADITPETDNTEPNNNCTGVLLSAVRKAVSDSAKADITPETDIPEPNIDNNCTGVLLSAVRKAVSDSANTDITPESDITKPNNNCAGVLLSAVRKAVSDSAKADITPGTDITGPNINIDCSGLGAPVEDQPNLIEPVQLHSIGSPTTPVHHSHRSDRKPSSAEEELAVVSLLSLCSGHPSDDSTPSSSTDQE